MLQFVRTVRLKKKLSSQLKLHLRRHLLLNPEHLLQRAPHLLCSNLVGLHLLSFGMKDCRQSLWCKLHLLQDLGTVLESQKAPGIIQKNGTEAKKKGPCSSIKHREIAGAEGLEKLTSCNSSVPWRCCGWSQTCFLNGSSLNRKWHRLPLRPIMCKQRLRETQKHLNGRSEQCRMWSFTLPFFNLQSNLMYEE